MYAASALRRRLNLPPRARIVRIPAVVMQSASVSRIFLNSAERAARRGVRLGVWGNGFFRFRRVGAVFIARGSFRAFRAAA